MVLFDGCILPDLVPGTVASIKFETLPEVLDFVCSSSSAWRAEQSVAPCCLVESPQGLATPLDLWIQAVCANVSIANSKICEQDSYGYAIYGL